MRHVLLTIVPMMQSLPIRQHQDHSRDWRENFYVYPVISRRSGGLSIGINLNPDTACNFDCIYCQVDRTGTPRVREVNVERVAFELIEMIELARGGRLYEDAAFTDVPAELRAIRDIAFSGDGEPTTCPEFPECVQRVAAIKRDAGLDAVKLVLITDACYLTRPRVAEGLGVLDENNGEIWAKLDAGTEEYYRLINRPNYPLTHVMQNIIAAARVRPVVIQSLFMRVDGVGPSEKELSAFTDRLKEILAAGGRIKYVQVYTVARKPAEGRVTALPRDAVELLAARVQQATGLLVEAYSGSAN